MSRDREGKYEQNVGNFLAGVALGDKGLMRLHTVTFKH